MNRTEAGSDVITTTYRCYVIHNDAIAVKCDIKCLIVCILLSAHPTNKPPQHNDTKQTLDDVHNGSYERQSHGETSNRQNGIKRMSESRLMK